MSRPPDCTRAVSPAAAGTSPPVHCLPCCTGCGACVSACPQRALSLESALPDGRGQKRAAVDMAHCTGCGLCLPACPRQALVMPAPPWLLP